MLRRSLQLLRLQTAAWEQLSVPTVAGNQARLPWAVCSHRTPGQDVQFGASLAARLSSQRGAAAEQAVSQSAKPVEAPPDAAGPAGQQQLVSGADSAAREPHPEPGATHTGSARAGVPPRDEPAVAAGSGRTGQMRVRTPARPLSKPIPPPAPPPPIPPLSTGDEQKLTAQILFRRIVNKQLREWVAGKWRKWLRRYWWVREAQDIFLSAVHACQRALGTCQKEWERFQKARSEAWRRRRMWLSELNPVLRVRSLVTNLADGLSAGCGWLGRGLVALGRGIMGWTYSALQALLGLPGRAVQSVRAQLVRMTRPRSDGPADSAVQSQRQRAATPGSQSDAADSMSVLEPRGPSAHPRQPRRTRPPTPLDFTDPQSPTSTAQATQADTSTPYVSTQAIEPPQSVPQPAAAQPAPGPALTEDQRARLQSYFSSKLGGPKAAVPITLAKRRQPTTKVTVGSDSMLPPYEQTQPAATSQVMPSTPLGGVLLGRASLARHRARAQPISEAHAAVAQSLGSAFAAPDPPTATPATPATVRAEPAGEPGGEAAFAEAYMTDEQLATDSAAAAARGAREQSLTDEMSKLESQLIQLQDELSSLPSQSLTPSLTSISLDNPVFKLNVKIRETRMRLEETQAELQALLDTPYDSLTSEPETYESIQISADPVESREAQEQMLRALSAVQQRQRRPQWGILPDTSPPERLYSQQGQHVDVFEALKTASLTRPTRTHAPQRRDQATQGSTAADPTQRVIQSPSAWVSALTAHEQGVHGDTGGLHAQEADDTHTNMTHQARAVTGGAERGEGNMEPVEIPANVTLRQLASRLGCTPSQLEVWLRDEMSESVASEYDTVSAEAAELAAMEWGRTPVMTTWADVAEGPARPPVVTIMGHVDHGKTSLLDALRHTSVAASEAGGITQHIGAFEVKLPESDLPITFLDTPGHAAFSSMRARGAAVTDIVVLVVAADDGVMPQTREALAHARAASCPIVLAITKCDLPTARLDHVKQELLQEGLELEEYGGSVQVVYTSAKTRVGLRDLTEAIVLQAETMQLRARDSGSARAVVVEASQGGFGAQATVIVQEGRLSVGDRVVIGTEYGTVRRLQTSGGSDVREGGVCPGHHALVVGLRGVPQPGDELKVVRTDEQAKRIALARSRRADVYRQNQMHANLRRQRSKEEILTAAAVAERKARREGRYKAALAKRRDTAAQLEKVAAEKRAEQGLPAADTPHVPVTPSHTHTPQPTESPDTHPPHEVQEIRLVVKADVQGSVEAVLALVQQLSGPYVNIKVLHSGVGPLTTGDVQLAQASGAHLVTFNLGTGLQSGPSGQTVKQQLREAQLHQGIRHLSHDIVYHLMDQLTNLVQGSAPDIDVEQLVGEGSVVASFPLSGKVSGGRIAGLRVTQGTLQRGDGIVRVVRQGKVVYQGSVTSLKREKHDVDSVVAGDECGLVVDKGSFSDFQPGDVLQYYTVERKKASVGTQDT